MKEYEFTGKAVAWVDEGPIKKLIVHCHERSDCKLVIAFGQNQKRLVEEGLKDCNVVEPPCA